MFINFWTFLGKNCILINILRPIEHFYNSEEKNLKWFLAKKKFSLPLFLLDFWPAFVSYPSNPIQVIRELISNLPDGMHPKHVIDSIVVNDPKADLQPVARTEARVFILYRSDKFWESSLSILHSPLSFLLSPFSSSWKSRVYWRVSNNKLSGNWGFLLNFYEGVF